MDDVRQHDIADDAQRDCLAFFCVSRVMVERPLDALQYGIAGGVPWDKATRVCVDWNGLAFIHTAVERHLERAVNCNRAPKMAFVVSTACCKPAFSNSDSSCSTSTITAFQG